MTWRNTPLWLKGGIIASGIYLGSFILFGFLFGISGNAVAVYLFSAPLLVLPVFPIIRDICVNTAVQWFGNSAHVGYFYAAFATVLFFVLGTLSGLIISTIRKRAA